MPEQLSEVLSIPLIFRDVNLCEPAPVAFTKVENGVTVMSSSQAVVWATPWPNSTGAPRFKVISAARVDLIARTPAIAPIAITTFRLFLPPFGSRPEDSKLSSDIGEG